MYQNIDNYLTAFNLDESEVLLVASPFSLIEMPCIGLEILKTISNSLGIKTSVLYANFLFANLIGVEKYQKISQVLMSMHTMLGERIFANAVDKTMPILGFNFLKRYDDNFNEIFEKSSSIDEMELIAKKADEWSDALANAIVKRDFKIVGISTGHQQTNAAISLINKIKKYNKDIICVIGGSSCDGDMATGVLSLCNNADYVFCGESEISWKYFLTSYRDGVMPNNRIIKSEYLANLDEIRSDDNYYNDFYKQLNYLDLIKEEKTSLMYESSRGCWWGEHHKCSFCGVNGWNRHYRHKSEQKVKNELTNMLKAHPKVKRIQMVDTLMPRNYLDRLISIIKNEFPYVSLFYEQRADLSFKQVLQLKLSGIKYTQVGIEALSTNLLKLVNKGLKAEQNIKFLRYAKSVGLLVGWNLLTEIPNDRKEDWINFLELLPLIYHLNPPLLIRPLEIVRFSPFFEQPTEYGIQNITPDQVYSEIFSQSTDLEKIAWLFNADYYSDSKDNRVLNHRIKHEVQKWIETWKRGKVNIPSLNITKKNADFYLEDSRFGGLTVERISPSQARVSLFGIENNGEECLDWGMNKKVICYYEGKYLPLATANPIIFKELNNE